MQHGTIPVSLFRGGTSKGVFLRLGELPADSGERDSLALALLGSPDPMQLDGLGGTHSSTSKLMAVGTAAEARGAGYDVPDDIQIAYLFAQVAIDRPIVDWRGNCGNLTAAVGSYAVFEGLEHAAGSIAELRLFNLNTRVRVTCRLPVRRGVPLEDGDFVMPGVPGAGARIDLVFHDPASAITGLVLPTGKPLDEVDLGSRRIPATIIDVTNPVVIVRAADLGLAGTELPAELNRDRDLLDRIEALRGDAAVRCGIVATAADALLESPAVPRVILASPPTTHRLVSGECVAEDEADFVVRTSSMGVVHHAFTGTGLMAAAAAAALPGTVFDLVGGVRAHGVRFAHPKGVVSLTAEVTPGVPQPIVRSVTVARTARRLMRGDAFPRPSAPAGAAQY
jgi:2-methylaconitate cis-trans-isomerase PrpF